MELLTNRCPRCNGQVLKDEDGDRFCLQCGARQSTGRTPVQASMLAGAVQVLYDLPRHRRHAYLDEGKDGE